MPSITSLVNTVLKVYPSLTVTKGDDFFWSTREQTIYYDETDPNAAHLLLHELGHALLSHRQYDRDVQLIAMESEAWEEAKRLGVRFNVAMPTDVIEDHLDTYRDWLHQRSTCPACQAIGQQVAAAQYECIVCHTRWRVNEARSCQLRRYKIKPIKKAPI